VRPYAVANGRTQPSRQLDLLSLVEATGRRSGWLLGPEHADAIGVCQAPISVAEVASRLAQPVAVTKIVLSDLIDLELVTARPPEPIADPGDLEVLEVVARGLRAM
jgi:hypothetical protein